MATTTGAAGARTARMHPPFMDFTAAGSFTSGRRRLLSVVEVVGAYVWGLHPAVRPRSRPGPVPSDAAALACPAHVAYPDPPPLRPCPADKPTTVAHYRAMADQVANERQLSELGGLLGVHGRHQGVPRETWFSSATAPEIGGRRRG